MKPTEFIVENSIIAQEADDMHRDHEVQMARSQLYSAAQAAIQIHRLLKDVSEMEGLEGWVQTKIAIASEYLESVQDYLKYEAVSQEPEMMAFSEDAAGYALDKIINEEFAQKEIDTAVGDYVRSGGEVKKGKPSKGPRRPGLSLASKHIGGGGDKMKPSRTGRGSNPQGKAVVATEQAPAMTGHGQFSTKDMGGGTKVSFDPTTGGKTVSGATGTTSYNVGGQKTSSQTPSIGGTSQTTNYQTGEKTTSYNVGPVSVSQTQRPDQSTVTSASTSLGDKTVGVHQGIGFGGAGQGVTQGGNQVKTISEKNKKLKEMATGGGSSAGGIATSMSGPGHKPSSGVPKKVSNSYKSKKVTVGKGIY